MVAVIPANTCDLRWVKWALREREQKSCDYTPADHGIDPDNLPGLIEGEEQQGLEVQRLHLRPGEGAQNNSGRMSWMNEQVRVLILQTSPNK